MEEKKLVNVTVCLDSGKLATDACKADIRTASGLSRVDTAAVYPEDVPKEYCTSHVLVNYCPEGQAVANDYCAMFAEAQGFALTQKALVKLTQDIVDEIVAAGKFKLESVYVNDSYIYLINPDGSDGNFKGLNGKLNSGVNLPYVTCTKHTKQAWDNYQATHPFWPIFPGGSFVG